MKKPSIGKRVVARAHGSARTETTELTRGALVARELVRYIIDEKIIAEVVHDYDPARLLLREYHSAVDVLTRSGVALEPVQFSDNGFGWLEGWRLASPAATLDALSEERLAADVLALGNTIFALDVVERTVALEGWLAGARGHIQLSGVNDLATVGQASTEARAAGPKAKAAKAAAKREIVQDAAANLFQTSPIWRTKKRNAVAKELQAKVPALAAMSVGAIRGYLADAMPSDGSKSCKDGHSRN